MRNKENQEHELLLKQLTRHFLKEQVDRLKGEKDNTNSSFIYLESNTLNMLLVYLLHDKVTRRNSSTTTSDESKLFSEDLVKELDLVIKSNKKGLEEIITILKEKT